VGISADCQPEETAIKFELTMDWLRSFTAGAIAVAICLAFFGSTEALAKEHDSEDKETKPSKHKGKNNSQSEYSATPCVGWVNPILKPRLALLCIHGLGLYSGSYQAFGTQMARLGIATYAIDVRGFGSWMKLEGHTNVDFKDCLTDVKNALEAVRRTHPGLPVFLLGESMGGAIALRVASMSPDLVEGVISSVPAGERFQQKKTDLKVALEFLKGKNKQFDVGTKIVSQATQNEKLREDWSSNPLDRMDLSPKELIQFQGFMNENHDAAKNITDDPVLFVQGTQDRLVKPEGTWELFNQLATPDKYFYAVPSEHLIFEEGQDKGADLVRLTTMVANWMRMVAAKSGTIAQNSKNNTIVEETVEQPVDPQINDAIAKLARGQNDQALLALASALKANPRSKEAHYWLAVTYSRLRRPKDAHAQILAALAIKSGSVAASQKQPNVPGSADPPIQATADPASMDPIALSLTNGSPAVVAFSAAWCKQCESLDGFIAQAQSMLGNSVKVIKVDVDDPSTADLARLYKVGPIPAVICLDKNGNVAAETIGQTNFINFAKGISAVVR
jgi:alpha-beta hydrolase superfamily lysophospholipase/thiol-disulfide isomerase/thioredoxin